VPSLDLFLAQPENVRSRVIGDAPLKVAVEAAVRFRLGRAHRTDGIFVGMRGFGASAPYKDLYRHFGITAEAVAEKVLRTHNL
jgi:transketolase